MKEDDLDDGSEDGTCPHGPGPLEFPVKCTLLILSVLAAGASATAKAQPALMPIGSDTVSTVSQPAHATSNLSDHHHQALLPTVDQEVASLCPRDSCDMPSLYRWVRSRSTSPIRLSVTPASSAANHPGLQDLPRPSDSPVKAGPLTLR